MLNLSSSCEASEIGVTTLPAVTAMMRQRKSGCFLLRVL